MQNKNQSKWIFHMLFVVLFIVVGFTASPTTASASKTYTIKTTTSPVNKGYRKLATYNSKTKQYYTLRSYLEKLEKEGGGTLVLKKGTYKIPCTLYVPSNVTIKLKTGVTIKKTSKTGSKKLKADTTLFELVPPSKAKKNRALKKYKSSKNVSFEGSGSANLNLSSVKESTAIAMGHNRNVKVSGISFKNMNGGSFITIAGSKKVSINACSFSGYKSASGVANRYAIKLEVPDKKTKAFPYTWSNPDNTTNTGISIKNSSFNNLASAIGSSKYTDKVYQTSISITKNTFTNLSNNAIRVLNWTTPSITSNSFSNIANGTGSFSGVLVSGCTNPTIQSNTFDLVARPIQITPATNTGSGKSYAATLNTIEATYASSFENNTVTRALEYYVRYQKTTAETSTVRLAYYTDSVSKDFVLSPGMAPFQDRYADQPWYNSYTKDYYALKSYLEQIERMGGGSITLTAGTYSITNSLFVPSNTTFNLQDGVVLNKGTNTGFSTTVLAPSLSMFQLVPPSLSTVTGAVSGYEGSQNVSFIGNGNVTIDMLFYNCAKSFVLCHNKNVTIKGINFRNYMGHHFIELDASQNVVIENCTFEGSKFTSSSDDHKEAINIDIPDKNTGGFNQIWTSYDRTPNMDIFIKNNSFNNVLRAIGTHKYSVSALDNTTQVYHTNVQILNNTISNTLGYAIRSINWKDCVIKGNTIKNVGKGEETAIFMSGTVNPTITENTIDTASRPITLNSTDSIASLLDDRLYPMTHTILDSKEKTGINISAMLNNTLIDMKTATNIRYYVGGKNKATSTETILYAFDESKIHYTYPTATPVPTVAPTTTPTEGPTASPDPEATSSPEPTAEPTATPTPSPEPEEEEE